MAPVLLLASVLVIAGGIGLAWSLMSRAEAPHVTSVADSPPGGFLASSQDGTAPLTAAAKDPAGVDIEVPGVTGKPVRVAETLIAAAGLTVQTRVCDVDEYSGTPEAVLKQTPAAGAHVPAGSVVTLTYQPRLGLAPGGGRYVVVIDPGHQAKADLTLEPDGPGSTALKPKVAAGATGVTSGGRESVEVLAIAMRVRDALKAAGVDVVMVRTADDVSISNSARAKIGNAAHADLVVRIHQSFSSDGTVSGATTYYPSGNDWVRPIESRSRNAAQRIEDALAKATGARRRGIAGRSDLSGFNYSTVPSIMVEVGYLSNPDEDTKMATQAYRTRIGNGITSGVIGYLQSP